MSEFKSDLVNISIPGVQRGDKLVTFFEDHKVLAEVQSVKTTTSSISYELIVLAGEDSLVGKKFNLDVDRRHPSMVPVIRKEKKGKWVHEDPLSLGQIIYLIQNAQGTKSALGFTYTKPCIIKMKDLILRAMSLGWLPQTGYEKLRRKVKKICSKYPDYLSISANGSTIYLVSLSRRRIMETLNLGPKKETREDMQERKKMEVDFPKFAYGLKLIMEALGLEVKDNV